MPRPPSTGPAGKGEVTGAGGLGLRHHRPGFRASGRRFRAFRERQGIGVSPTCSAAQGLAEPRLISPTALLASARVWDVRSVELPARRGIRESLFVSARPPGLPSGASRSGRCPTASDFSVCFLLFVLLTILFLATRTRVHTYDAVWYRAATRHHDYFHPHHLFYNVFGTWFAAGAAHLSGGRLTVLPALQGLGALSGAACVVLLYCVLRCACGVSTRTALPGSLLLAFSYAFWYYSSEVEVYVPALVPVLLSALLTCRAKRLPNVRAVMSALLVSVAAFFHQTNLLIAAPLAVYFLRTEPRRVRAAKKIVLLFLTLGIAVSSAYVVVAANQTGSWHPREIVRWTTLYAHTGAWGRLSLANYVSTVYGVARTIAHASYYSVRHLPNDPVGDLRLLFPAAALALFAVGVWFLRGHRPRRFLDLRRDPLWLTAAVWCLVLWAFFGYWEPKNNEFWIGFLAPGIILVSRSTRRVMQTEKRDRTAMGLVALAGSLLLTNLPPILYWNANLDPAENEGRVIAACTGARDLCLLPRGTTHLYAWYFSESPRIHDAKLLREFTAGERFDLSLFCERAKEVRQAGGNVLVSGSLLAGRNDRSPSTEAFSHTLRESGALVRSNPHAVVRIRGELDTLYSLECEAGPGRAVD
ncbi:MAG: glycosyltransferase family 39 protein [Candidatus Eisenbacteria bacterium]